MSDEPNENNLTAWERWELASFDAPTARAKTPGNNPQDAATAVGDELEQLRQQAHEAGHQTGYATGYAEGQTKARNEATRLGNLATQLDAALNEFDQRVSEDVLALALEVARQVIRQSIAVKPELLLETLRQALAQMPHPHATISIHPQDASLVRLYLGDQLAHVGHRLHEDQRIKRGGCIVEAGGSQIDASLETRWRRVVESLGSELAWLEGVDDGNGDDGADGATPPTDASGNDTVA